VQYNIRAAEGEFGVRGGRSRSTYRVLRARRAVLSTLALRAVLARSNRPRKGAGSCLISG